MKKGLKIGEMFKMLNKKKQILKMLKIGEMFKMLKSCGAPPPFLKKGPKNQKCLKLGKC